MPALLTTPSSLPKLSIAVFGDLAGGNRFGDGFEIRYRRATALLDLIDHFFRGRGTRPRTVGGTAGIVDHHLGALGRAEQRDFLADAAPGAGDDDDFVL
jgi:hypothetical protein